ncbi:hypothetical protein [Dickeya aquatica]|uniref:hypothetical protein n=1 Tax=Dickeya aquatica TaxID=1401087 RepID=UPI00267F383A
MRNIDFIREVTRSAVGCWPDVLALLGIEVPRHPTTLTPCPACGVKTASSSIIWTGAAPGIAATVSRKPVTGWRW